jgi:hypothetical protein
MKNDLVHSFYYALPNNGSQEGINSATSRMKEAKICAEIAEEFAIGFAEWIYNDQEEWYNKKTHELLEIYKKEKGL